MNVLKKARENRGLSQSQLSLLCGVPVKTIQNYEQNHRKITGMSVETAYKFITALGITIEELLEINHK